MAPVIHDSNKNTGFFVEGESYGKTEVLGGKPVSVLSCPPQIPYGLAWFQTRTSAVRGRPVPDLAMPVGKRLFTCTRILSAALSSDSIITCIVNKFQCERNWLG